MTDQVDLSGEAPEPGSPPDKRYLSVREAAFIGVGLLAIAIASAGVVLVVFVFTTLIHEPASIATLLGIIVLGFVLDFWWKRVRADRAKRVPVAS